MCATGSELGMPGGSAHLIGRPKLFKAFYRRNQSVAEKNAGIPQKMRRMAIKNNMERVRSDGTVPSETEVANPNHQEIAYPTGAAGERFRPSGPRAIAVLGPWFGAGRDSVPRGRGRSRAGGSGVDRP